MEAQPVADTTQLLTTPNFIGPGYHVALLFSGFGSIVLLFVVLFSQQIREDLARATYCPTRRNDRTGRGWWEYSLGSSDSLIITDRSMDTVELVSSLLERFKTMKRGSSMKHSKKNLKKNSEPSKRPNQFPRKAFWLMVCGPLTAI